MAEEKSTLSIVPSLTLKGTAKRLEVAATSTITGVGFNSTSQDGVRIVRVEVSEHLTEPPMTTSALIVAVPEETPVALVVYGTFLSESGDTVATEALLDEKLTLLTLPRPTLTMAEKVVAPPIAVLSAEGIKLTVQVGAVTVKVDVSEHLTEPPISTWVVMVTDPLLTPLAVVVYGDLLSEPGDTVAIELFDDENLTLSTLPVIMLTDAVKVPVPPNNTLAEEGLKLTLQSGGGGEG